MQLEATSERMVARLASCASCVLSSFRLRYPPFSLTKVKRLEWLMGTSEKSKFPWRLLCFFFLVAALAVIVQTYGLPSWVFRFLGK